MKIVLVDDSAVVRARMKIMLAELPGIEITGEAADVAEAVEVIQEQEPDVVILDLQLPSGSGIDVLRKIKRTRPEIVVIMLTNYATPQYRHAYLSAGADYFLDKFAEHNQLMTVLEELAQRFSEGTA